ncbi:hypothetical protein BOW53_07265 [Solemya pervernicosa gill symbiont]|uniref:UPF0276 protein BOW53_07265 n=1 Tax=Solemya pervernicosa gill symbiont TaxID=642797 RepID=A0A1T2L665_9GAMM|nr:DUF692 domain-containing protein [Solemya pervernicosa gill symbiont]OOZ40571.1 hypothetical protein BOW53_07265 [Solemya pervernicosa gill symbiont]
MNHKVHGAGLGLRRPLLGPLTETPHEQIGFLEVAPENWMGVGGALGKQFRAFTESHPFILHGLSLSVGGPAPLDENFLHRLKTFMGEHNISLYSEHLSYCADDGHLYDLMPIPFTEEAVEHVAARIRKVQDILGQRIAMENVSYYAAPGQQMAEIDFFNAVIEAADCDILLDVNNVYVNSVNHCYDPLEFIKAIPSERIAYLHIAGHYKEAEDLLVDTHGAEVLPSVWQMLDYTYRQHGVIPTLLERDFNLPPLEELLLEVDQIRARQLAATSDTEANRANRASH